VTDPGPYEPGRPLPPVHPPVHPPDAGPWTGPPAPAPWPPAYGPPAYGPPGHGPSGYGPPPAVPARRWSGDPQRIVAGWVLVAFGIAVGHSALTGSYTDYVRVVMKIPLLAAALVLLAAGIAGVVSGLSRRPVHHGDHGHDHGRRPVSTAVLLALVPLLVLVLFRPAALDAAATERVAPAAQPDAEVTDEVEPLPGRADVPLPLSFYDLFVRVNTPGGPESVQGRKLVLQGFVAKNQTGVPAGQVRVGRYKIWCCAADGTFSSAEVGWPAGAAAPAPGQWFTMTVAVAGVRTVDTYAVPFGQASSVRKIVPPEPQYE
jgi:uncharacterized repeat protein (TIGR03943 family)